VCSGHTAVAGSTMAKSTAHLVPAIGGVSEIQDLCRSLVAEYTRKRKRNVAEAATTAWLLANDFD
jgi:hypothetical protein